MHKSTLVDLCAARQSRKYHISNRRGVSEEERQTAYDNAMSHMKSRKPSGVPMFAVTMSQTNVCVGFNLACSLQLPSYFSSTSNFSTLLVQRFLTLKWFMGVDNPEGMGIKAHAQGYS